MLQNPQLDFCPSSYKELVRVYGSVQKTGTHTKIKPPSSGLYYLFRKMEGAPTENFIWIRNYCFSSESSSVYGTG
jgi:hypothetical protein